MRTADPVFLNIPIPLVPPVLKLNMLSDPPELVKAAVPSDIEAPSPCGAPTELPPCVPPILVPLLVYAAPKALPKFCSKVEDASTINASIKTCLVLLSISLITLSTISKSFSFPLTIIDLVVFSSVT